METWNPIVLFCGCIYSKIQWSHEVTPAWSSVFIMPRFQIEVVILPETKSKRSSEKWGGQEGDDLSFSFVFFEAVFFSDRNLQLYRC